MILVLHHSRCRYRPLQVGRPTSPSPNAYQQPNHAVHRQLPQPQVTPEGQGHRGSVSTSGGGQRQMSAPPEVHLGSKQQLGTTNQHPAALIPRSPTSRRSHIPYT